MKKIILLVCLLCFPSLVFARIELKEDIHYTTFAVPVSYINIGHGIDGAKLMEVSYKNSEPVFGEGAFFNVIFPQDVYDRNEDLYEAQPYFENAIKNGSKDIIQIKFLAGKNPGKDFSYQLRNDPFILAVISIFPVNVTTIEARELSEKYIELMDKNARDLMGE